MNQFVQFGRRCVKAVLGFALVGALAACGGGGGGNSGTPVVGGGPGGGSTPATLADLSVSLDKSSVSNNGNESVTVTVTSIDANRSVVGSVPVTFAVDNYAIVSPAGTSTDASSGQLKANVQIGDIHTSRTITVTATSGSISQKRSFEVVDSVTGGRVADLSVLPNRSTMPNDGSVPVVVTVTSMDAGQSVIGGSPVTLRVNDTVGSGGAFINTGGKTATDTTTGQLAATLSLGTNHSNRTISVTAVSGTVERTVSIDVVDPTVVTSPKAADLYLDLSSTSIDNAGTGTITVIATAVDASRNALPGIPVSFAVDSNAIVVPGGTVTDALGRVTAAVRIGSDRTNRLITVTAKSDALVRTATFRVTGATLQGASTGMPGAGSANNKVEFRLSDVNNNAMAGVPISVTAPGLTSASGTTDVNGSYTYTYTAPTTPGSIDITANAGGATSVVTVTVSSGTSTVPAAVGPVVSAAVSANPTVVSTNTDETSNRAEIRALFLAANNVPVKNVRVRFDLNGDGNNIGGTIASGTSLVYSDAGGAAISSYRPGARSSPTNGVTIRACWDYSDFAAGTCPNQTLTSLTVVSDPLSITIGTNEAIEEGSSGLTYIKRFVLMVVDAAGNPKSDVQITPSVDLTSYTKGYYLYSRADTAWLQYFSLDGVETLGVAPVCRAEDLNRNGSLDSGEDKNGNNQLDPRKSDVSISMVGSTKTDSSGTAVLKIEYAKSLAGWVNFRITASAAGVLSPPAYYPSPTSSIALPVSATAIKTETPPPAFVISPYGILRKAADVVYCTNSD